MKIHKGIIHQPPMILCRGCGRRWNDARIENPLNQKFLWDHAESHLNRRQPTPEEVFDYEAEETAEP